MPVVLTSTTVVGLLIALVGTWLLSGDARVNTIGIGAALAYLAGGVPAGRRALKALWNEHILDIDLLMIVAAIAAAGGEFHAFMIRQTRRARRRPGRRAHQGADGAAPGNGIS